MNHKIADGWAVTVLICASACWGGAIVITKSMLTAIPPLTLLVINWVLVFSSSGCSLP